MTDPMGADDLRASLDRLELSQRGAAKRWGLHMRTLTRWLDGSRPIPPLMPALLALEEGSMKPRAAELKKSQKAA